VIASSDSSAVVALSAAIAPLLLAGPSPSKE